MLKPLVVSWGYESEFPSGSNFIDHHEWWGTRDMAAFLSVPKAIEFQRENNWDEVRDSCHRLVAFAQNRICELTGLAPLHPQIDKWFCQMAAVPLPADANIILLKNRLYDDYRIEIPVLEWFPSLALKKGLGRRAEPVEAVRGGNKLIRVSVQGYNTKRDIDSLIRALSILLE